MMKQFLQATSCLLLIILTFSNCRKKEWEQYYGRPSSLAPPIYQQLKAQGNFTNFLDLIDKAGYKKTLSGSGYWTLFAPNDSAFKNYFVESGIKDIQQIDSSKARAIVQYLLIYNSFKENRLDDYQATVNNAGWTPDIAFRRRTAYYDGFYQDTNINGQPIIAIADNRNNSIGSLDGNYDPNDYNNKSLLSDKSTRKRG